MKTENVQIRSSISKFIVVIYYINLFFVFIAAVTCAVCKFFFSFFRICFIPRYPYNFRYLVIVSFNFTVYDIVYIKKKTRKKKLD